MGASLTILIEETPTELYKHYQHLLAKYTVDKQLIETSHKAVTQPCLVLYWASHRHKGQRTCLHSLIPSDLEAPALTGRGAHVLFASTREGRSMGLSTILRS